MKAIVGVDLGGQYEPALDLCLKLGFPNLELLLVHAVEPVPEYAPPMEPAVFDSQHWMAHLRKAGDEALRKASSKLEQGGFKCRSVILDGSPAAVLDSVAESESADLIVIGAAQHSALGAFLLGSVARSLAVGARKSLLITKTESRLHGPIHALFATDHSPYAEKSLDKLLSMSPNGISRLDVATAFEMKPAWRQALEESIGEAKSDPEEWVAGRLESQTARIASSLEAHGFESKPHFRKGHPNEALPQLMAESGAQLMVLGAQGHGFLERLFIGSVSLRQVSAEEYPVLLIRVG